jgi:multidrug efflux pump
LVLTPCLSVLRDKRKEDKQATATIILRKEDTQVQEVKKIDNAA